MLFTFKYLVIYTDIYTKGDLKRKSLYVVEYEWPRKRLIRVYYVHGRTKNNNHLHYYPSYTHIISRGVQVIILTRSRFGPTKCIHPLLYTLLEK